MPFTGTFMAPESRVGGSAPKKSREGLEVQEALKGYS